MAFKKTVKVGQSSVTYFSKKSYEKSKKKKFAEEKKTDIESAKRRAKADAKIDAAKAAQRARVDAKIAERAKTTATAKERVAATKAANVARNLEVRKRETTQETAEKRLIEKVTPERKAKGLTEDIRRVDDGRPGAKEQLLAAVPLGKGAFAAKAGAKMVFKRGAEWQAKFVAQKAAAEAAATAAKTGGKAAKKLATELAETVQTTWAKGFGLPDTTKKAAAAAGGKLTQAFVKSKWIVKPGKPGTWAKLKGFVLNTKNSRLITQGLTVAGLGLGATYVAAKIIETFSFPEFTEAEGYQNANFAMWRAQTAGDDEAMEELRIAVDEASKKSTWDKIFGIFPWLRQIPASKFYLESGEAAWETSKSVMDLREEAGLPDVGDDEFWNTVREKNLEAKQEEIRLFEEANVRMADAKALANKEYLRAKTASDKEDRRLDLENTAAMVKLWAEAHAEKLRRNKLYWVEAMKMRENLMKSQLTFGLL